MSVCSWSRARYFQETALILSARASEREVLQRFFTAANYHVLSTRTRAEAIELCRNYEGAIHLLVTDLDGEDSLGWTLAETATTIRPGLLVLFLSSDGVSTSLPKRIVGRMPQALTSGLIAEVTQALTQKTRLAKRRNWRSEPARLV